MDELNKIRKRQMSERKDDDKKSTSNKKRKKRKMSKSELFIKATVCFLIVCILSFTGVFVWATYGMDYNMFDSITMGDLQISTLLYYVDDEGNEREFEYLKSDENRIWCDIDKVPEDLKNAFVAIEDQRFYSHHGVDFKRTLGAVLNVAFKGDSSYGGSTITQQLIKNVTRDNERSSARKIREMVRAFVLETKMSKEQILEMYMNSIYLGHGIHGVQSAAMVYFNKDVSELNLVECAAIAGITQYPSLLDPINNPENNKEKRNLILDKMYELEYITKEQYQESVDKDITLDTAMAKNQTYQSYFTDYVYDAVLNDMVEELDYTEEQATQLLYNGGLKIITTVDPDIQRIVDSVFEDTDKLPKSYGSKEQVQAAMIITDPSTGQIKAIAGGVGKKEGARVLNRASQTLRQPGSSIKPIAVYGPAIDKNVVNMATLVENTPLTIGDWSPKNADREFSHYETVRTSVQRSLNLPAVRVLEALSVNTSYDYLTNKLHMDTLVSSKKVGNKIYTDKNLASLALGGLTEGVTVEEMNGAYQVFANGGQYIEPCAYTKVYDSNGELLLEKEPYKNTAFSEATAYIMNQLLLGVTRGGTAAGTTIAGIDVCGKTGTTDENHDRWFVGYTPYYCATVWYGFDKPQQINVSGTNPALTIWRNVMYKVHEGLKAKTFAKPSTVTKATICSHTGKLASGDCGYKVYEFVNEKFIGDYCNNKHNKQIGTKGVWEEPEEEEEDTETEENDTDTEKDEDNQDKTDKDNKDDKDNKGEQNGNNSQSGNSNTDSNNKDESIIDLDKLIG